MKFPFHAEFTKLRTEEAAFLLKKPETGMGYQIFKYPGSTEVDPAVISNATLLSEFGQSGETPVFTDFDRLNLKFEQFDAGDLKQLFETAFSVVHNAKFVETRQLQENELPPYLYITRPGDEFRRLSAYRQDKRITEDGTILPGTYGTTISDLTVVPSGIAAVGRYALPNRIAATYVYQIIPQPGTHVYFGTVMPNFGLCGGGVEVYFPNGCDKGSARLLSTIKEI